jgi:hypothetical protein
VQVGCGYEEAQAQTALAATSTSGALSMPHPDTTQSSAALLILE